jgi:nucleotide-binding universal stress UspA family protein
VEFVVAVEEGTVGETVLRTAELENCDLIVGPYETDEDGELSRFVRTVLSGDTDAVVFRTSNGRTEWHRVLVMVRSPGEVANAMLDFAHRLVTDSGTISACTCISHDRERRTAETMLGNVIETLPTPIETRIAHGSVETFLERNASHYDLAVVGASTDRSAASRFLSTPTFERIRDLECDLAIVHRG